MGKQGLARAALGGPPGEPLVFFQRELRVSCMHNAETFRLHLLFIGLNIDLRKELAQALVGLLGLQLKKHRFTKAAKPPHG